MNNGSQHEATGVIPLPDRSSSRRSVSAVLVVRAWREDANAGFRARVTHTDDIVEGEEQSRVVASPEEVEQILQTWIKEIARI